MCVLYNPYHNKLSVKMAVPNSRWIREQMSSADITPANFDAKLQEDNALDYDSAYYDDMDFDEELDDDYYDEDYEEDES